MKLMVTMVTIRWSRKHTITLVVYNVYPDGRSGAAHNFPEKLPTVSETEAKVFVMVISSKQFQFVRSSSRLDVMMGPLRWVITVQTTTRKAKLAEIIPISSQQTFLHELLDRATGSTTVRRRGRV